MLNPTSTVKNTDSGFTLMEVIVAIVILASSLTVIIGLQYSSTQKTVQSKLQQQAMLLARVILTEIEMDPSMASQTEAMPALELIEELDSENPLLGGGTEKGLEQITATLQVEEMEIPMSNSDPVNLKKVILIMSWSDNPSDAFEVIYYVPDKESNEAPL